MTSIFEQEKPISLYPVGVPNSKPTPAGYVEEREGMMWGMVSRPTITPYLPAKDKATGTAVIICPGGSYLKLALDHEGKEVAEKFAEIGVIAFVLKYRLPNDLIMVDKTIGPLQDAQRAIQIVRERAAEWGVNPAKIGIVGFSAGGHLASTVGTHFNRAVIDNKNNTNLRPDFMVLLYPVITFGQFGHRGSQQNLLGADASQELIDLYSNEQQVTPDTPPTFIMHARDDDGVSVQNSQLFYDALLAHNVKAEIHLYPGGGHGFGLHNPTTTNQWFNHCVNFIRQNGF